MRDPPKQRDGLGTQSARARSGLCVNEPLEMQSLGQNEFVQDSLLRKGGVSIYIVSLHRELSCNFHTYLSDSVLDERLSDESS